MISLGSLVGFFTVFGIAARNGILLVNHCQHLEKYEGEPFGPALVLRGARERLSPILMTSLATGLALVPLVVLGDRPGHEIEYPLAVVILGGLVTSTASTSSSSRRCTCASASRARKDGPFWRRAFARRTSGAGVGLGHQLVGQRPLGEVVHLGGDDELVGVGVGAAPLQVVADLVRRARPR